MKLAITILSILFFPYTVLYQNLFEGSTPLAGLSLQQGNPAAMSITSSRAYEGLQSLKVDLHDTDPLNNNGTRAEISYPQEATMEVTRWYSFAIYFESANYAFDNEPEIITQWHQGGGVSPPISLEVKNDHYRLHVKADPVASVYYDLGPIVKDQWNLLVFHIIHADAGLIQVWANGTLIHDMYEDCNYNLTERPVAHPVNWKTGIYKWKWNGTATTLTSRRVAYYDNVRKGDETSTYDEISGDTEGEEEPPPPPPPSHGGTRIKKGKLRQG